jgi:uncharacterized protein YggT (Ycf19 family)
MSNPELFFLSVLRALVEVALLSLVAQGLLAFLAGSRRDTNPVYQLFRVVTRPVLRAMRAVTPKPILDRHLPIVSFFVLFWVWILLAYAKRMICQADGLVC